MIHNFKCPHCGAPLSYDSEHDTAALKCDYCEMSTPVPLEFRPFNTSSQSQASQAQFAGSVSFGPSPETMAEIQGLLRGNNKIEAIKIMRGASGLGLKEAKDFIDAMSNDDADAMNAIWSQLGQGKAGYSHLNQPAKAKGSPVTVTTKKSGGCGGVLAVVILFVVGAVIFSNTRGLVGLLNDSTLKSISTNIPEVPKQIEKLQKVAERVQGPFNGLVMQDNAALVQLDDKAQPDILGKAYEPSKSEWALVYINAADQTLRWRTPNALQGKFAFDGERVYSNDKTHLSAIDRKTGQTRWQSTLSDEISASCNDCLQPLGEGEDALLIAMSNDDNLQAFDARTGKRLWNRMLSNVLPRFWVWGDKIVVLDRHDDAPRLPMQVTVLSREGEPQQQFDLRCAPPKSSRSVLGDDVANAGDAVLFDGAAGVFYTWFGTFNSCLQKYDLSTGEQVWSDHLEIDPPRGREAVFLLEGDKLFIGGSEVMLAVNTASGKAQALVEKQNGYDYLQPIGYRNDVVLMQATRTRGTRRLELWAVGAGKDNFGKRLWQRIFDKPGGPMKMAGMPFGTSGLFKEGDESDLWTWRFTDDGLRLLHLTTAPKVQWIIETVNLQDGVSAGQKTIDVAPSGLLYSVPAVLGWQNDVAWVQFYNGYYAIDTAKAEMVFETK